MDQILTPVTVLIVLGGFVSGVLAAVLGVGGAMLTTPTIRFLGATPIASVGSTVPAIIPAAIAGSLRYQREGYIRWRLALPCGLAGLAFAALGAWVAGQVDARWLMVATGALVLWSGVNLLRGALAVPAGATDDAFAAVHLADADVAEIDGLGPALVHADELNQGVPPTVDRGATTPAGVDPIDAPATRRLMVGLGVVAGFLAGLLGIGGGLVLTPGLLLVAKLPIKQAIATSLVAVAMMSTTAFVAHAALGHIDWRFAVPLVVGVVPGARVGAHIAVGASERNLRLVCGALLVVLAFAYLSRELVDIL